MGEFKSVLGRLPEGEKNKRNWKDTKVNEQIK